MATISSQVKSNMALVQKLSFGMGVLGLCISGALFGFQRKEFFESYLIAYIYFFAIGSGSLALLMIQHVAGGAWGFSIRRLLEAGSRTLLLLAVLFVPLLFGLPDIYQWARPDALKDRIIELKSGYLNVPFFLIRQAIFFAIWIGLAYSLSYFSKKEDETGDESIGWWFKAISGPGLVVFAITVGLTSVDWAMSVDVHWYSSMYPVLFAFGCILSAMIFHIVAMILLYQGGDLEKYLTKNYLRDFGSFLLGFIIFWTYLTFSQFLLIWCANIKEEVPYYINRISGGWQIVTIVLAVGHFALPFLFLLRRETKRVRSSLLIAACFMLIMRFTDYLYLLGPSFSPKHFHLPVSQVTCLIGIGGLWLSYFIYQWNLYPPIAARDPRVVKEPVHGV